MSIKFIMLTINNLTIKKENVIILENFNLQIPSGEQHILMGKNGSGKSTLAKIIAGDENYKIMSGLICYKGKNLLSQTVYERAQNGIFLSFQSPVEIFGVTNYEFLFTIYKERFKNFDSNKLDNENFITLLNSNIIKLGLTKEHVYRYVNDDFSGGEKKKNELLQILLLKPDLIILDELDSGLDVDSISCSYKIIEDFLFFSKKSSAIIITHYPGVVSYILPTIVHIINNKNIKIQGNKDIIGKIERFGYSF